MAAKYDPTINRLRQFRFHNGNDAESLQQERMENILDIEELGLINRTRAEYSQRELFGTLLVQPFHFAFGRTSFFKSLHPYLRVTLRLGFIALPLYWLKHSTRIEVDKVYQQLIAKKVYAAYEDPLTMKYKDLIAH